MEELSLYILDIVQNSIAASATFVSIKITEDKERDLLIVEIADNGKGINPELVDKVTDPFFTTRNTRKVGLGLSLFKAAAQACGGDLFIRSKPGEGTTVKAIFRYSHIDRPPLGKMDDTVVALIVSNPCVDFVYVHETPKGRFELDTREIRNKIGNVPVIQFEVIDWIRSYVREGLKEICGGE